LTNHNLCNDISDSLNLVAASFAPVPKMLSKIFLRKLFKTDERIVFYRTPTPQNSDISPVTHIHRPKRSKPITARIAKIYKMPAFVGENSSDARNRQICKLRSNDQFGTINSRTREMSTAIAPSRVNLDSRDLARFRITSMTKHADKLSPIRLEYGPDLMLGEWRIRISERFSAFAQNYLRPCGG
jgi:hypothetical protein